MSGYDEHNAVLFVVVGAALAAALGYVCGAIAAYIQGRLSRRLADEAVLHPDQNEQREDLVAHGEQLQFYEQRPLGEYMEMEGWGEVVGYLVVRDVEDGLISFVRDEDLQLAPGRR